jgi:hypothetical protein
MDISNNPQIGTDQWPDRNTSTGGDGTPVDDINCTNPVPDDYHVHAHLSIIVNGEAKSVPAEIGFVSLAGGSRCIYGMHTHDKSGKLHLEASAPRSYTLGQFFRIWGQPLENTNVAGYSGLPIRLFVVDGSSVSEVHASDWAGLELTSHLQLTFEIGTPIDEIPTYTWSSN